MIPFEQRFPECAEAERLVLHIQGEGLPLPPGKYGFFELYCDEPNCDCRRAVLQVLSPQHPGRSLATINFSWESKAFYTEWTHGDIEAGREITAVAKVNADQAQINGGLSASHIHRHEPPGSSRN